MQLKYIIFLLQNASCKYFRYEEKIHCNPMGGGRGIIKLLYSGMEFPLPPPIGLQWIFSS